MIVHEGHQCYTPRGYSHFPDRHGTTDDLGTIYECEECGTWWISRAHLWNVYERMTPHEVRVHLERQVAPNYKIEVRKLGRSWQARVVGPSSRNPRTASGFFFRRRAARWARKERRKQITQDAARWEQA